MAYKKASPLMYRSEQRGGGFLRWNAPDAKLVQSGFKRKQDGVLDKKIKHAIYERATEMQEHRKIMFPIDCATQIDVFWHPNKKSNGLNSIPFFNQVVQNQPPGPERRPCVEFVSTTGSQNDSPR